MSRPLIGLVLLWIAAAPALAQEPRLRVVVEYVAGANLYLDAGTAEGLIENDTLLVFRGGESSPLGSFRVVTSSGERSVVTFAGAPFPVTRGDVLEVVSASHAAGRVAEVGPRGAEATRGGQGKQASLAPKVNGRISLDFSALHSRSEGREVGIEPIDRYFTTPVLRVRTTITHLPADLTFRTSLRAAARMSSDDVVEPERSLRVYEGSVGKSFRTLPLEFQLGRFFNPYENYSGYWDGLLVRVGPEAVGGGFAVGFHPEFLDEGFSSDLPKGTLFFNVSQSRGGLRYRGDVSLHQIRTSGGGASHTFAGLSQRLGFGYVRLRQQLQVDREAATGDWTITQLILGGSIAVSRELELHADYGLRRPSALSPLDSLIADRRDRATAGAIYSFPMGNVGFDVTATRIADGDISYSYSSSLNLPRTPIWDVGLSGFASYWMHDEAGHAMYLSLGLNRAFARLQTRLGYVLYESEGPVTDIVTHTGEAALTFPLTSRIFSSVWARIQRGANLNSDGVYTSIWMRL